MSITLSALQKQRTDTAANWTANNPTLLSGELGFESDTGKAKLGDGSTAWTSLGYLGLIDSNGEYSLSQLLLPLGSASAPSLTFTGDENTGIYSPGANQVAISTNGTQRATIDNTGRLLVGTASALDTTGITPNIQSADAGNSAGFGAFRYSDNAPGPIIHFFKSRGTSVGTNTIVQANDVLGEIRFTGADGTNEILGAQIKCEVDGTPGQTAGTFVVGIEYRILTTGTTDFTLIGAADSNPGTVFTATDVGTGTGTAIRIAGDMPGRLVFSTTAENAPNPTERMRITLDGKVGIGTTSPGYSLDVAPPAAGSAIRMRGGSGGAGAFQFTDATASSQWGVITATSSSLDTAHSSILTFSTASSERARIDSSGRLLVGTPSARDTIDVENTNVTPSFQIEGGTSSTAHALITRYTANNFAGYFSLAKTRSSTVGNHAVVADDDSLGRLRWLGDDGTDFEVAAQIEAFVDGTPGANDMPGRLVFSTTADGASSPTERMRISSDGRVGINGAANDYQNFGVNGTTTQTDGSATEVISARPTFNTVATSLRIFNSRPFTASGTALTHYSHFFADPNTVNGTVASQYGFAVSSNLTAGTNNYGFYGAISSGTGRWNFYASGTANNYFSGTTLINTTDASTTSNTAGVVFERQGALIARRSATCLFLNRFTSDGNIAAFYRSGTNVGTISVTTTATAYNTSSDYRLKENVVDLTGAIDRVNQLQVRRFNFIADPDTTVDGFIAHEAQAVVPESVTGTKDAVEDIGTLTEWDGTVIETDVTEPESLTWEETITDEDGNETVETHTRTWVKTGDRPVYQGIDQSKLVPLLTAALQEALAEIESLKARVTALEP